jgi:hypothetical protein
MKLKLEIEFDENNKTIVEKEFDEFWNGSQLDTILTELAMALVACGFSESLVEKNIDYPR